MTTNTVTAALLVITCSLVVFSSVQCLPTIKHETKRERVNGYIFGESMLITTTDLGEQCCSQKLQCCDIDVTKLKEEIDVCMDKEDAKIEEHREKYGNSSCPYDQYEKNAVRTDLYCPGLELVDESFRVGILPTLKAHKDCITVSGSNRLPKDLIQSLEHWHKEMIKLHTTKNCCFKASTTEIPTVTPKTGTTACNKEWGKALEKALRHMIYYDSVKELGTQKKKKCLRGCVGPDSILKCANKAYKSI